MNTRLSKFGQMAVVGALSTLSLTSQASVKTFAEAGGWNAFGGRTNDGHSVCGMASSGGGRWIGIKYFEGDSYVTVQLSKNSWNARNGERVQVRMEFDRYSPWTAVATSFHMDDGDVGLEFTIDKNQITQWTSEFAGANTLYVRFPQEQNIEDWQADLSASQTIAGAWSMCILGMAAAR